MLLWASLPPYQSSGDSAGYITHIQRELSGILEGERRVKGNDETNMPLHLAVDS